MSVTISSKGQVIIPADVREDLGWKKGTKLSVQETPFGILLVEVPEKPLKALKGILKEFNISSKDIRKMRQEDEKKDRSEHRSF